jgi:hypothetical protein
VDAHLHTKIAQVSPDLRIDFEFYEKGTSG